MSKAFSCILIAAIVLSAAGCRNHRPDSLSKPAQQAEPAVIAKTMNQGRSGAEMEAIISMVWLSSRKRIRNNTRW